MHLNMQPIKCCLSISKLIKREKHSFEMESRSSSFKRKAKTFLMESSSTQPLDLLHNIDITWLLLKKLL